MADWEIVDLPAKSPGGWEVVDLPPRKRGIIEGIVSDVKHLLGGERTPEEQAQAQQAYDESVATMRSNANETRAQLTGASLGLFPRIEAAVEAVFTDKDYDKSLEDIRKEQLEWAEKNPGTALAAEITGGIAMPVSIGVRAGQRAGAALTAATGSNRVGAAAATAVPGAAVGGAYSVGSAEDWSNPLQTAREGLEGAAFGAIAGPVTGALANGIWGASKGVGRGVRDLSGRIGEWFGTDATPAAERILARVAEGEGIARLPGVSRDAARRSADDLQASVNAAHVNGVDDSLVTANPRVAALVENLAGQSWMPDQPFENYARRALGGQQERVAEGVATTLRGAPGNHTQFMDDLERQSTTAFDDVYDDIRLGIINGQQGNMQVQGLYRIADENPETFNKYLQQSLQEVVADPRVQFEAADAARVFGTTQSDLRLIQAQDDALAAKAVADRERAAAQAALSDAKLNGGDIKQAKADFDVAQNAAYHADVAARDAEIAAQNVRRDGRLLRQNLPPAVVERLYANLSEAAHAGDRTALRVLEQMKGALRNTQKGNAMMSVKEDHANAFARLEAAQKGENIWASSGTSRSEIMRGVERGDVGNMATFTEAAAGGAGMRVAGDTGSFSRPNNIVGSAENRATLDQLFGEGRREAAQDLVRREGALHDTVNRLAHARHLGNRAIEPDGAIANLLKFGVQAQFTPSVAAMNLYRRSMTGITRQRGAAIAQLATTPDGITRVQAYMRAREAARGRIARRRQAISGMSQIDVTDDPEE
jgi:hypothetical protein